MTTTELMIKWINEWTTIDNICATIIVCKILEIILY
jgi:hypothetical protein